MLVLFDRTLNLIGQTLEAYIYIYTTVKEMDIKILVGILLVRWLWKRGRILWLCGVGYSMKIIIIICSEHQLLQVDAFISRHVWFWSMSGGFFFFVHWSFVEFPWIEAAVFGGWKEKLVWTSKVWAMQMFYSLVRSLNDNRMLLPLRFRPLAVA